MVFVDSTVLSVEGGEYPLGYSHSGSNCTFHFDNSQLADHFGHCLHVVVALEVAVVEPTWDWSRVVVFKPIRSRTNFKGKICHMEHLVFPTDHVYLVEALSEDKQNIVETWRVKNRQATRTICDYYFFSSTHLPFSAFFTHSPSKLKPSSMRMQ